MLKGVVNPIPPTSDASPGDVITYNGSNVQWSAGGAVSSVNEQTGDVIITDLIVYSYFGGM